jgi:hypothetical protein
MIEGIRLRAQLCPMWEKVSPALKKNPRYEMFCKKSGYTKKNQGTGKNLNIMGNIYLINHFLQ